LPEVFQAWLAINQDALQDLIAKFPTLGQNRTILTPDGQISAMSDLQSALIGRTFIEMQADRYIQPGALNSGGEQETLLSFVQRGSRNAWGMGIKIERLDEQLPARGETLTIIDTSLAPKDEGQDPA
jgi:hypothetical protein